MRPLLATCCVFVAAACASKSGPPTVSTDVQTPTRIVAAGGATSMTTTATISATAMGVSAGADRVWKALPAVFDSLSIPITTLLPTELKIGNDALKARRRLGNTPLSRYVDCGGSVGQPNAELYDVTLAVSTKLAAAGKDSTNIFTSVTGAAKSPNFSGGDVPCTSTGRLEERLATLVRQQLRR